MLTGAPTSITIMDVGPMVEIAIFQAKESGWIPAKDDLITLRLFIYSTKAIHYTLHA